MSCQIFFLKIVTRNRGGYCFEHNKLFFYAMQSAGLDCYSVLGRVVLGTNFEAPRTHRISIVEFLGVKYLVDVGFGAHTPSCAIPLDGSEVVCQSNKTYRVVTLNSASYALEVLKADGFYTYYTFELATYYESDFNIANYYTNCHPSSKFVSNLILSRITSDYTVLILNSLFSKLTATDRIDHEISSAKQLQTLMDEEFLVQLETSQCGYLFNRFCIK